MNRSLFTALYCLLAIISYAQEIDEEYVKNNYTKIEQYIPMRDSVRLFTSIYIPKDKAQKYPILLNRTPYTVAPYGIEKMKRYLGNFAEMTKACYILSIKMYAVSG
ncbi:CocE/NonD family hydrolase [Sphingobacterium pedocola]|uniref:CocE/NonD family hydrolase n=1 Tax=Sphingobacterium pedocola TaxID=2082722 RepID=UPI0028BD26EA|nr:CocE/NonD family hydrolase [Sphingobacterium pedocola]